MLRIISGKFKGRMLEVPKSKTRPTLSVVREALFNICQTIIPDATFLDLFAGSGAIGLEAISRGASHVTFVEKEGRILKKNCATLEVEALTTSYTMDVFKALPLLPGPFDIIFADPPYKKGLGQKLIDYLDDHLYLLGGELFLEETDPTLTSQKLLLKSKRKLGNTLLYQFQKKS